MRGRLILIGGLSGSGKTTLMREAASRIPNLEILQTFTTRPMREGEVNGREYVFVTDEAYEARRRASTDWDHLEAYGFKYGADAGVIKRKLRSGINIICTITPKAEDIRLLEKAYDTPALTVWVEVPHEVSRARIATDSLRSGREEQRPPEGVFKYTFSPEHQLEVDIPKFCALIASLIASA